MEIRLADKSTVLSSQVVELPLVVGGHEMLIPFRIVPVLNHGMILGMQWFNEVNPLINWKTRELALSIDGEDIGIQCCSSRKPQLIELCSAEQFRQCLKDSKNRKQLYAIRVDAATCNNTSADNTRWTQLCDEYADVFSAPAMPQDRSIKHRIDLLDPQAPIKHHRPYRMSQAELAEVRTMLDDMLAKGWIRPSTSQYNHPILFVPKKDGTLRMCIDYRALNDNTIIDRYPIPRIDDILDRLGQATIFSKIDLQSGYHQVAIEHGHEHRTAFQSRFGLYEYTVLPMGLCNAPATFQRLVNEIFREQLDVFVTVYLDDILVFSPHPDAHEEHLRWVFYQLRKHSLKAKRKKCAFGLEQLEYLGHIVSKHGISVDPTKTRAISECAAPTSIKELQMFLGMCNYYARFVHQFATIAAPLYHLLQKEVPWHWAEPQQHAFDTLKHVLTHAPVLAIPNFDKPFWVETDASDVAIGGVLQQNDRPVAYYSKSLTSAERNYPVHDKELLAIVQACKRWRPYLDGQRTIVYTDHKPLIYLMKQTNLNKRQVRWLETLAETPVHIEYRPGSKGVVPDALSRIGAESDQVIPELGTVLVEPSFLARLSQAQFDETDAEMATYVGHARSQNADFCIVNRCNVPLVVKCHGKCEQVILPATNGFRELLLEECHSSPLVGHLGVRKMLGLLQQRVWWPRMRAIVAQFCKNCDVCARIKDSTLAPPGALSPLPVPPSRFHSWSLDFVSDLPAKSSCNCILTCVDRLTKYVRLIPCWKGSEALSASMVAKLFVSHIVRQFGVPSELVHDRDPRFVSAFWSEFWKALGTKTCASSAYHPQTDGQTERTHRTLEQILRAHCLHASQTAWHEALPLVEFAINSTVNVSTGYSPFYMLYGQEVSLPIDHALQTESVFSNAPDMSRHVHDIVSTARDQMAKAQESQKAYYDRRHTPVEFSPGDWVLLSTKNLQLPGSKKLLPRFIGPILVEARLGSQAYRLKLPPSLQLHHPVFHVSLLRSSPSPPLTPSTPQPGHVSSDDAEEEDDSTSQYEVERIVAERRHTYRIRWLGYDASEDTWVKKTELMDSAPEVVATWKNTRANTAVRRSQRLALVQPQ